MCDLIQDDIGVLLIAEEALTSTEAPRLLQTLGAQPAWSDVPIIVFTSGGEALDATARVMRLFEKSGSVTLLERPVHTLTLVSAIQGALRARRRQWQLRELLTQREHLLAEARAAREDAELANRTKDQFLATLSHELRTPLNAILGWTQLLRGESDDGAEPVIPSPMLTGDDVRVGIETIERNARTQAQLIEDLLDVSRIVSGQLRLELQETDVNAVLHAAVTALTPTAASRGVEIRYERDSTIDSRRVVVDPARLQQIVWNLLSNAVKFTNRGGEVVLRASYMDGHLCVTVTDTGIGIDNAFIPYVFDRFRQADGTSTRRQGGLGLGLSIVKQLTELHGGTVRVESDGLGKGTTFSVLLPLKTDEHVHTPTFKKKTEQDGRQVRDHALDGLKVLVVDDEADARDVLRRLLHDQKALVRVAESVTHALTLIQESKPDVIISDISMPDQDGFDLLRAIRSDAHAKEVPVIALTAYASDEDRARILGAGFAAHVSKPLDQTVLLAMLREI
jgi:signal transduction histidine kinase